MNGVGTAEIPNALMKEAKESWSSSVIWYSLSLKLGAEGVRRFAQKNWKLKGDFQVFQRNNDLVILKFAVSEDRDHILQDGPWFLNSQILIVCPWEKGLELRRDLLSSCPVCLRVLLPIHFFNSPSSVEALSRLASIVGKPLFLDQASLSRPSAHFTRICVEVEARGGFLDRIQARIDSNMEWIPVCYEWKPLACSTCFSFGHSPHDCPSKPPLASTVPAAPGIAALPSAIPDEAA